MLLFFLASLVMTSTTQDTPATPEQAAAVLDLTRFPVMKGASVPGMNSLATLTYLAPGSVKEAAEHHRQKLAALKWTELAGTAVTDEYASATFTRDGYKLSLMISPYTGADKPDHVSITLMNHGNVDAQKLPVPPGCKPLYATPVSCAYTCELSPDEARQAVASLLLDKGWHPYGSAGDVRDFKRHAIKLAARVAEAPAQQGKTVIDYSTLLMSADLPAPPDALRVQYSDAPTQLSIDLPGTVDEAVAYYRNSLAELGWTATTENLIKDRFKQFLVFRNAAKDMLDLEITVVDDKPRLLLRHRTAAQLAELEEKIAKPSR
jgi:hypothetical protein